MLFFAIAFLPLVPLLILPQTLLAQTYSVILNPMPFSPGSKFGMRMHPIQKVMKLHAGQDYPIPIGTNVPYQGKIVSCAPTGSAGVMATVGNACGVTQRFMHLTSCNGGKIISGNTGGSTGPHLHYEIRINGTAVDPIKAAGQDLCKEDVRKQLLEDAKNKGSGSGGGGASANSNAPPPEGGEVDSVTYVPPGGTNPVTGEVNTGNGYYIIETTDGRVYTEAEIKVGKNEYPILGPTTTDVVPTGKTSNSVTGCATDTWTAMVNQAVLQTRREVMINNRYILKPDSVIAYSCMEDSMKKVGELAGPIFSESKRWVNKQINILNGDTVTVNRELGEFSLDGAIANTANAALISFVRTSFPHDVMGGLYDDGSVDVEEGTGQDGLPCGTMAMVWNAAKCMNADDDPLFPRFDQLIEPAQDPRKYPVNMSCQNTGITQGMIDIAKNKQTKYDKIDPYINILYPNKKGECPGPIYTGVTVERFEGPGQISFKKTFQDGVCITAGCSYQNSGGSGSCEVAGP